MQTQTKRLDNGNIELTFSLAWTNILDQKEKVVEEAVKNAELKGFRKGHAPRNLVEAQLEPSKVLSQAISQVLPTAYTKAVEDQQLKPVIYPKIQVQKGKEGEDWEIMALVCEAPEVTLPDLAKTIGKLDKKLETRVEELVKASQVKLSDLIVEEEANHRLSQLAENLSGLGITVEKYLDSKKSTLDELKAKTATEARHVLAVEFVLQKVQVDSKLKDRKEVLDYITNLV